MGEVGRVKRLKWLDWLKVTTPPLCVFGAMILFGVLCSWPSAGYWPIIASPSLVLATLLAAFIVSMLLAGLPMAITALTQGRKYEAWGYFLAWIMALLAWFILSEYFPT